MYVYEHVYYLGYIIGYGAYKYSDRQRCVCKRVRSENELLCCECTRIRPVQLMLQHPLVAPTEIEYRTDVTRGEGNARGVEGNKPSFRNFGKRVSLYVRVGW